MNAFWGIIKTDGSACQDRDINRLAFNSPHWTPDHSAVYVNQGFGVNSVQRFITAECDNALLPNKDSDTGCVVIGDVFLSNRNDLLKQLGSPKNGNLPDAVLALNAYLKWGSTFLSYLKGRFSLVIWDPRTQNAVLATDPFAKTNLFYAKHDNTIIFSNFFSLYKQIGMELTINTSLFYDASLDNFSPKETSYNEVAKLPHASFIRVSQATLTNQTYSTLRSPIKLSFKWQKRSTYFKQFRQLFKQATAACTRSPYPILAHISGGLDSSSVASMAAKLLAEKNRRLYGVTSIPKSEEFKSDRVGWRVQELDVVQSVLDQYPTIDHMCIKSSEKFDPIRSLERLQDQFDRPFRNVCNFEWIQASLEKANALGCRSILTGQNGNLSISWKGHTHWQYIKGRLKLSLQLLFPKKGAGILLKGLSAEFSQSSNLRNRLRYKWKNLSKVFDSPYLSTSSGGLGSLGYSLYLWYGVRQLDPTQDMDILQFCNALPQRAYYKGSGVLDRRLLVREGLTESVPEAVRFNKNRGEQSPEWYKQFNTYAAEWRSELKASHTNTPVLWEIYDYEQIFDLFNRHPIKTPTRDDAVMLRSKLMRILVSHRFLKRLNLSD